jgi:general nucleoside transport system permease protein
MDTDLILNFLGATLRSTTPLLFAALGGLFSERSGVTNIGLEGTIIFGALAAAVSAQLIEAPFLVNNPNAVIAYAPWLGLLTGAFVGGLVGLLHAVMSIRYKADQVISGTAINLMAVGIPALVLTGLYDNASNSTGVKNRLPDTGSLILDIIPQARRINPLTYLPPELEFLRTLISMLATLSPLVYLAFLLVPVVWYVVYRTPFGLRLRSVGEHPEAADSVGINVRRVRYYAVILSGVLAGLAGAYLSIGNLNQFTVNMSAGRGFIALAALIFGKWNPWGVLGATLLFGAFDALRIQLGGGNLLPPTVLESVPFILTMLVLAGFIGRAVAPKAIGKPFEK